MKTKKIVYCGPFSGVDAEGLHFPKGKPVEVSSELADSLLAQDFTVEPVTKENAS